MPDRFPGTWADVAKGDYVESVTGQVWKVTHEVTKDDGRYLGIQNAAGEQKIIGPNLGQSVIRLVYGDVTEEEAVATVQAVLGGEVLHGSEAQLLEASQLKAHLVRFHGWRTEGAPPSTESMLIVHRQAHALDPDIHTHQED